MQVPALSPFAMATARGALSEGPSLRTPFATACLASPFEAPSPRDMHLSPAEERLVPTPSLMGRAGSGAGDAAEGESPRETAERERASRMLACLWANTEKAPWAEVRAPFPSCPQQFWHSNPDMPIYLGPKHAAKGVTSNLLFSILLSTHYVQLKSLSCIRLSLLPVDARQ